MARRGSALNDEAVRWTSAPLPLSMIRRVDQACDRFEAEWQAGRRPEIERYLETASGPERLALLHALLVSELELRQGRGERPTADEYLRRFPRCAGIVDFAFAGDATALGNPDVTDSGPAWTIDHPSPTAPDPAWTIDHPTPAGSGPPEETSRGPDHARRPAVPRPEAPRPGRPGRGLRRPRPGAEPRGGPEGDPGPARRRPRLPLARSCWRPRSPAAWSTRASCPSTAWADDADGRPYYAMRLIRGESLRRPSPGSTRPTAPAATRASDRWRCGSC